MIQIGDEVQELNGAEKEAFLKDRELVAQARQVLEAEQLAKQTARASALAKLAALGLSAEEIAAL